LARKILLADDSVTAQNMGRKILVDAGYEVITVNNGSAALKRVNDSKPDLVVLDVYMPGYSGLEVCERLKETFDTAHIPVLLTVGKLEPFKPDEARRVRADAHIVKPFEASELLRALAHLEERIVSSPDPDTSWKSRLRFPAQKKKENKEADSEPVDTPANFHDFRRRQDETAKDSAASAQPATPEPEATPAIPRDMTLDELDALSALAANLDAQAPAESVAPATEPPRQPEETAANEPVNTALFTQEPAPIDQADEPMFVVAAPAEEGVETKAVEAVAASEPTPAVEAMVEASSAEAPKSDQPRLEEARLEEAGLEEQKSEEPRFEEPAVEEARFEESKTTSAEIEPAKIEAANGEESPAGAVVEQAASDASAAPTTVSEQVEDAEYSAPTDEELAQALRLLTPSSGSGERTAMPSASAVSDGSLLSKEDAVDEVASPHWVAEPVALTPEEAATSLEAEMFGPSASEPVRKLAAAAAAASQVATMAAAAQNPIIEPTAVGSSVTADSSLGSNSGARFDPESTAAPVSISAEASPAVEAEPAEIAAQTSETSIATPPEEHGMDQAPPATFADMPSTSEGDAAWAAQGTVAQEITAQDAVAQAANTETPAAEEAQPAEIAPEDSTPDSGGQADMGKRGAKTGKSVGRQVAQPAPAVETHAGEAAIEASTDNESPKTMAAAAAADSSAPASADPNQIAAIVESVLADLRPKIVEEIAKKLAGK